MTGSCDILLNNSCEVFNKYILEARELPILQRIKSQLMTRHYNKQKEAENFQGDICPKIRKKVAKNAEFANICYAVPSGKGIFQVQVRDYQHIVDIGNRTCDCRRWQLTGIPCNHSISCLRHERIPPESMVADCYSIQSFMRAYGQNIWPCLDISEWEKTNGQEVTPPVYEKKVGRPPKARKKQPQEIQGKFGPKLSKHGVVLHCSWCKSDQHNVRTCAMKKAGQKPKIPPVMKPTPPDVDAAIQEEQDEVVPVPAPSTEVSNNAYSYDISQAKHHYAITDAFSG
jgi:hypothetical protein